MLCKTGIVGWIKNIAGKALALCVVHCGPTPDIAWTLLHPRIQSVFPKRTSKKGRHCNYSHSISHCIFGYHRALSPLPHCSPEHIFWGLIEVSGGWKQVWHVTNRVLLDTDQGSNLYTEVVSAHSLNLGTISDQSSLLGVSIAWNVVTVKYFLNHLIPVIWIIKEE